DQLGAQGTVCAGGRYDGLVEQIGGRPTPATGFAMGLERLLALQQTGTADKTGADIYLVVAGREAEIRGLQIAEQLREAYANLRTVLHCGGGSFKSQMKKADKSGAAIALVLGEQEIADNTIGVKPLRTEQAQTSVSQTELLKQIAGYF
ncbi:MAG: His/Gly/Thr/Pro-type tRNA ligase C-terminal domain-containing protein, partial [Gammaproteobacteria bacterium]